MIYLLSSRVWFKCHESKPVTNLRNIVGQGGHYFSLKIRLLDKLCVILPVSECRNAYLRTGKVAFHG